MNAYGDNKKDVPLGKEIASLYRVRKKVLDCVPWIQSHTNQIVTTMHALLQGIWGAQNCSCTF